MPADPFKLDYDKGYSPSNFYTRSTNKHDHAKEVRALIPPDLHAMLFKLQADEPAYRTVADIVKDALYHRVRYLLADEREIDPELRAHWEMQTRADMNRELRERRRAIVETASVELGDLIDDADDAGLKDFIDEYGDQIKYLDTRTGIALRKLIDQAVVNLTRMQS